ncbi:Putative GTP-binding protein [Acidilobus saccharovorans 345-15]|uniref:Putative GTP-binding protein n=1 Tax=Acidilobus saccharovorans (strain DSM 16705 / JCM 18335 / VKM B-2471 / 345-15) TaxID=666510 RepID=D9Q322_ACIS3|nr:Putative GTP-binding protein [Acidilobus saccharovorans 345-15]
MGSARIKGQLLPDPAAIAKRIHVPSYSEVLQRIKNRYPHNVNAYERERRSLDLVKDVIVGKTEPVMQLRSLLRGLHPFYLRLLSISFDMEQVNRDIECVVKARTVAQRMWQSYRYRLLAAESEGEARAIGREARGRMMSQLKKCSHGLERLREVVKFLAGLPGIDVSKQIVIVSGPPNAGKSTFLSSVSRARPEIAPYPFTTKNVIVGHANVDGVEVQVIDTPGLLDRDPSQMNEVELRAVAALQELPGPVLYLVDPTPEAPLDLESQVSLLSRIRAMLGGSRRVLVVINKVDAVDSNRLNLVESTLLKSGITEHMKISALDKEACLEALRAVLKPKP